MSAIIAMCSTTPHHTWIGIFKHVLKVSVWSQQSKCCMINEAFCIHSCFFQKCGYQARLKKASWWVCTLYSWWPRFLMVYCSDVEIICENDSRVSIWLIGLSYIHGLIRIMKKISLAKFISACCLCYELFETVKAFCHPAASLTSLIVAEH